MFFMPLLKLDGILLLTLAPPPMHSPLFIPTIETPESMAHQSKPHLKELQHAHLLETHCFPVLVSSTSPTLPLMDLYWITEVFLDTACTVIRHNVLKSQDKIRLWRFQVMLKVLASHSLKGFKQNIHATENGIYSWILRYLATCVAHDLQVDPQHRACGHEPSKTRSHFKTGYSFEWIGWTGNSTCHFNICIALGRDKPAASPTQQMLDQENSR